MEKMNKKKLRAIKMRKNLIEAAKFLFRKNGYKNTTVDEIVDQALISKATFYQYFKSKEELFYRTIEDSGHKLYNLFINIREKTKNYPLEKRLRTINYYIITFFERDHYLIYLDVYRDSSYNSKIIEYKKKFAGMFADLMEEFFIEIGVDKKDARSLGFSIKGAAYYQIMQWFFDGKKENLKLVARHIHRQFYPFILHQVRKNKKEMS